MGGVSCQFTKTTKTSIQICAKSIEYIPLSKQEHAIDKKVLMPVEIKV